MRIKTDFITNSSSTSFCGWGIEFHGYFEDLPKNLKEKIYQEVIKNDEDKELSFEEFQSNSEEYYWQDYLDIIFEGTQINYRCHSDYNDVVYIGLYPGDAPKNKTIDEIIEQVQKTLNDLGFERKVTFILSSWYDG